jgi:exodeoxyribonuclease-3
MGRVADWLTEVQPDVLCMQETKMTDEQFPSLDFLQMGYESVHFGQSRWNGVAILSKVGLSDPLFGFADGREPDVDARIVWATCGGVRVCSVYVPNGRELTNDHYTYKLDWLGRLRTHLELNHSPDEQIVIMGDWNVAPEDRDVWSPKAFEGGTHVSQPERDALQRVKDWGLIDTLRERYPQEQIYSFWDYRNGDFHKRRGIRIDFLLSTQALAEHCSADLIDRNARKGTKPSDHAPVMGVFDL